MAVAGGVVFTWYGRETRGRCLWDLCLKHLANISGLWRLLPALWEQTTAEGWLPKKASAAWRRGSGQTPTALSRVPWLGLLWGGHRAVTSPCPLDCHSW